MPDYDYVNEDVLDDYLYSNMNNTPVENIVTGNLHGIFGVPYQFMEDVDLRLDGTDVGRVYAEKIMSKMPLLFITPGKQVFMEGFSKNDKKNIIQELLSASNPDVNAITKASGKYYSFEYDYATYYKYVNTMCWVVARYLGIDGQKISVGKSGYKKISSIDWSTATNDDFKTYFSSAENVIFYLDGMTNVSETFSNSTMESSLASTVNGLSDTAKELKFILGDNSAMASIIDGMGDVSTTITSSLSSAISGLGGGLLAGLTGRGINTILSGGKISFPELWSDSSFDRSYSLDIKLRSPDCDPLSIYLNILVPYIHLLALVLPKNLDGTTDSGTEDPNGYTSPFLVKAFCKGIFNVDMGMITDLSVSKGAECQWNDDGLPTQIDISLSIKDLYSLLSMSTYETTSVSFNKICNIVANTSMMDFLANMSGLNLAQMEMGRKMQMFTYLKMSEIKTIYSRTWTGFDQLLTNSMNKIYRITS